LAGASAGERVACLFAIDRLHARSDTQSAGR
jgi:hypothetical protein